MIQMRIIKVVKPEYKYDQRGSAVYAYWERVKQFDNEPVVAFEASVYGKPPGPEPHYLKNKNYAKSKHPEEWLNQFKRKGLIEFEYEKSDRKQWFLPCPNCGEVSVLSWKQFNSEE